MTLRNLPEAQALLRPTNYQWDAPSDALARWSERPLAAAESDDANVISIYDPIGEDLWTGGGFTAKRAAAALRSIGRNEVTVKINSPGGDVFEGLAIYNLLREHKAKVTIEVMGIAASAASVIAMAGDDIRMGLGTFMMVHNVWGVVVGNKADLRSVADVLEGFDAALIDIYEARTGRKRADIAAMMDREEFLGASEAVEKGFADAVDSDRTVVEAKNLVPADIQARRRLDAHLAKTGMPRSERRRMLKDATGRTHDAAPQVTRDADLDPAALARLIETMRS